MAKKKKRAIRKESIAEKLAREKEEALEEVSYLKQANEVLERENEVTNEILKRNDSLESELLETKSTLERREDEITAFKEEVAELRGKNSGLKSAIEVITSVLARRLV